jgi:hypothetical protein
VTPQEQAAHVRDQAVVLGTADIDDMTEIGGAPPVELLRWMERHNEAMEAGAKALETLAALTNAIAVYPSDTIATDVTYFGVEAIHAERMVKRLAVTSPSEAALWQVVARRNRLAEAALAAAANLVEAST